MDPVVVVSHQRNKHQYYDSRTPVKFGPFGSPPSGNSGPSIAGHSNRKTGYYQPQLNLIPQTPVTLSASFSPKTPSPSVNNGEQSFKGNTKSSSTPIPLNIEFEREESFFSEFQFFERWAGPVYSNSPPPSSLPMPHSLLRPKRTTSLSLPTSASKIDIHPMAKSAPSSPTWKQSPSSDLFNSADSATKTLRRILNLDITD